MPHRAIISRTEVKRLWSAGKTAREIAVMLKCSRFSVSNIVAELGLQRYRPCPRINKKEFTRLWKAGKTAKEISSILGCTESTAWTLASDLGLPRRYARGQYGMSAKRWSKQDDAFLHRKHGKMSIAQLAEHFDVSPRCISRHQQSLGLTKPRLDVSFFDPIIKRLWGTPVSVAEIAKAAKITIDYAWQRAHNLDLKRPHLGGRSHQGAVSLSKYLSMVGVDNLAALPIP